MRGALQLANFLQGVVFGPGPVRYMTNGVHSAFELMVRVLGRSPTSAVLLRFVFGDVLGLPRGAYLDFSRPRERDATVDYYRSLSRSGYDGRTSSFDNQIWGST